MKLVGELKEKVEKTETREEVKENIVYYKNKNQVHINLYLVLFCRAYTSLFLSVPISSIEISTTSPAFSQFFLSSG